MKKYTVFILCYFLSCLASTVEAQVEFTLVDGDGFTVGNVYPVKQGETITVTLAVSNIPSPGLFSMGYSFRYDPAVVAGETSMVDATIWPYSSVTVAAESGKVDIWGVRLPENGQYLPPVPGPGVPLGTFTFTKIPARGRVQFTLQELLAPDGANKEDMVTGGDNPVLLDAEIPWGLVVGTFTDPGDYDGDGDVDGKDLYNLKQVVCPTPTTCHSGFIQDFVANFGY